MLNAAVEKRIAEMETICDELPLNVSNGQWSDYALGLLAVMQRVSLALDDFREDAEERFDSMMDAFKNAWITTESGQKVHFNESGEPDKGNPHVLDYIKEAVEKGEKKEKKSNAPVKNVSSSYGSPYPMEEISAEGENKPCKGFSKKGLQIHKHSRHAEQYAHMSDRQYEEHAIKLLQKKCGPDIWGYRSSDGSVCRFNRLTGEYAKGYPGGDIKTCFYPTPPNSSAVNIDVKYARDYFMR